MQKMRVLVSAIIVCSSLQAMRVSKMMRGCAVPCAIKCAKPCIKNRVHATMKNLNFERAFAERKRDKLHEIISNAQKELAATDETLAFLNTEIRKHTK
jgi:hypothetical protein